MLLVPSAAAVAVKTAHVEAELVAAKTALVPGEPITVALRLVLEKGWHTYWRNPGDSGLPTTLEWKLPEGVKAGPIEWPAPQMLPVGPLVNYGYEGVALHLVEIRPQRSLPIGGTTILAARADWLVCKEVCIPEGADLTLALPVAESAPPDARWGPEISAARAALPAPLAGWSASAIGSGTTIAPLTPPPGPPLRESCVLPYATDRIDPQGRSRSLATAMRTCSLPVAPTLSVRSTGSPA